MRIPNHKTTSSSTEQRGRSNAVAPPRVETSEFFFVFLEASATDEDENARRTRAEDENFACVTRCAREGSREYAGEPILLGAYRHSCLRLARNVRARSAV